MLGYQTIYEKSMNGIKVVSDGQATISDGNLTATNVVATNITGTLQTANQPNITNVGTLSSLNVSGITTLKAINTDSIVQSVNSTLTQSGLGRIVQSGVTSGNLNIMAGMSLNANADVYFSGTGKIEQIGSGTNVLKTISMTSNSNISQSGTGIISQSGSQTNALKATNVVGAFGLAGNITQTSGSNSFQDSTFTNINQSGNSTLIQAIGGTGTNALNKTTITELTVTNALIVPSGITMPSATFNGDTSYIGTAKIVQSGSTGTNDFNESTINGNLSVSGNFNMTGGSATSIFKTPTVSGLTTLEGIVQTSGTSSLRSISTNQLDVNANFNIYNSGTGIISQSGSGTNAMKAINIIGPLGMTGNIVQTSGSNILLDTTMGNITLPVSKTITFNDGLSRKIQLHSSTSYYGAYAFDINNSMIRYNVDYNSHHVFTNANSSRTAFEELARINNTGLGIGIAPSYKLHVLGTTKLDGINLFTTSLNGITPLQFSYLDATSSIQTQLNNINIVGNTNGAQIAILNTKTTDQSYTTGLTTFSSSVNIASILYLIGNLIVGGQTLTPVQLSYLANVTSNIQTQLNALSDLRITNTNNINTLITKTTDLSYGSSVSTFANNVNVNGVLTIASNKNLYFSASVGQKIVLHPGPTLFNNYMISVEQDTIRYNINYLGAHKFSMANNYNGISFVEMMIIHITGTTLNTNLTVNGNINGITPTRLSYLDATSSIQNQLTTLQTKTVNLTTSLFNGAVNGTINGILPAVFAFLDSTSSLQGQFNTLYGYGVSNNTNITSLFNKTTDISYASSTTTIANQLNVNGNLTVAGNKTLTFLSSTTQKIVLYPSTTLFNNYMIAIEPATIRYNTDFNGAHLFSIKSIQTTCC
jgi:hypothetical protein